MHSKEGTELFSISSHSSSELDSRTCDVTANRVKTARADSIHFQVKYRTKAVRKMKVVASVLSIMIVVCERRAAHFGSKSSEKSTAKSSESSEKSSDPCRTANLTLVHLLTWYSSQVLGV